MPIRSFRMDTNLVHYRPALRAKRPRTSDSSGKRAIHAAARYSPAASIRPPTSRTTFITALGPALQSPMVETPTNSAPAGTEAAAIRANGFHKPPSSKATGDRRPSKMM